MNPTRIGDASEACVLAALVTAGCKVLIPWSSERYDFVLDMDGAFVRFQVKTGKLRESGVINFRTASVDGRRRTPQKYTGEVDGFLVYCPQNGKIYAIPIDEVPQKSHAAIRVSPTKNNQRAGILWASRYELPFVACGSIRGSVTSDHTSNYRAGEGIRTLDVNLGKVN